MTKTLSIHTAEQARAALAGVVQFLASGGESAPADAATAPRTYGPHEWRPTWSVNFGDHADMTLRDILTAHGPQALLPYRNRAVSQLAAPRTDAQETLNRTMLAHIDELLQGAGYKALVIP